MVRWAQVNRSLRSARPNRRGVLLRALSARERSVSEVSPRDSNDAEATSMRYIYYCERCGAAIQVEVDEGVQPPPEVTCPKCDYPHAAIAFAAPQQSGCCGPAPRSGGG